MATFARAAEPTQSRKEEVVFRRPLWGRAGRFVSLIKGRPHEAPIIWQPRSANRTESGGIHDLNSFQQLDQSQSQSNVNNYFAAWPAVGADNGPIITNFQLPRGRPLVTGRELRR